MRLSQRARTQSRLARALDALANVRLRAAGETAGSLFVTAALEVAQQGVTEARAKLVALNVRQFGRPAALLGGESGRFTRSNPAWIVGSPNGIAHRTRVGLGDQLNAQARREARGVAYGERSAVVRQWTEAVFLPLEQDVRVERPRKVTIDPWEVHAG